MRPSMVVGGNLTVTCTTVVKVECGCISHSEFLLPEIGDSREDTSVGHRWKNRMLNIAPVRLGCFCGEGEHGLESMLPLDFVCCRHLSFGFRFFIFELVNVNNG